VRPEEVAAIRKASKDRLQPWTIAELRASIPQPLPNRREWKLTASAHPEQCPLAVDGKADSRYSTGADQAPGQWFQIELPQETVITGIELDTTKSPHDYPRGYKVELSKDGKIWGAPVATGQGNDAITEITFAPAPAKFIRITQTGVAHGNFWSIHEMELITPPGQKLVTSNH